MDFRYIFSSPLPQLLGAVALAVGANALFALLLTLELRKRHADHLSFWILFRRIWPPARDRIGEWLCQGNLDDALWREIKHRRWLVIGFSLLTLLGLYFVFGRVVGSHRSYGRL